MFFSLYLQVACVTDYLGRDQILPVSGSRKYQILPENPDHDNIIYETVQDLINATNLPAKVIQRCGLSCLAAV